MSHARTVLNKRRKKAEKDLPVISRNKTKVWMGIPWPNSDSDGIELSSYKTSQLVFKERKKGKVGRF